MHNHDLHSVSPLDSAVENALKNHHHNTSQELNYAFWAPIVHIVIVQTLSHLDLQLQGTYDYNSC